MNTIPDPYIVARLDPFFGDLIHFQMRSESSNGDNILASVARQSKKPDVTIAIGFAYSTGLLVASDSQMSFGPKYKQCDEPKVSALKFGKIHHALLAISGSLDGARCFQQILEEDAPAATVDDERSIANVSELALKKTRAKLLAYVRDDGSTPEERIEHLVEHDFEVLLAYYYGKPLQPFIYRLKLRNGIAIRSRHPYEAIGCGSDIAGFILTGADFGQYSNEEAICLAFYAVESCKKFDQACGGPVQHILLPSDPSKPPKIIDQDTIAIFEDAVRKTDKRTHRIITQHIMTDVHDAYVRLVEDNEKP